MRYIEGCPVSDKGTEVLIDLILSKWIKCGCGFIKDHHRRILKKRSGYRYFLLLAFGPNRAFGAWMQSAFHVRLTMVWYSAIFASVVVAFPLMYRTARGAFESFDPTLRDSARTLGLSDSYIFWRIQMPCCRQGILAGTVLAFARALGEYGATSMIAGYTPGRTATISTTVYQLWRTNNDALAFRWVMINVAISFVVLMAVNLLEKQQRRGAA